MIKGKIIAAAPDVKLFIFLAALAFPPRVGASPSIPLRRDSLRDVTYSGDCAVRQSMFNYAQMHFGVSAGMLVADHIRNGKTKPRLLLNDTEDAYFA